MMGIDLPCKTGRSVGGTLQRLPNDRWAQFFSRGYTPSPPPPPHARPHLNMPLDIVQTLPKFSLKPFHFWIAASFVNLLPEGTRKILDKTKLQDCKRVRLYADEAQNVCFISCPFDMPFLPLFQVWANPGLLVLLFVLTAASLTILPAKDLSH